MPKITKVCEIENCLCCFHSAKKNEEPKVARPRGRPKTALIDETHKKCRICGETKELSEMRPKRNECLGCYNQNQREYYRTKECYIKYKIPKIIAKIGETSANDPPIPEISAD
jgi:hypothetical protein